MEVDSYEESASAGAAIKSVLIGAAVVLMGPIGLLFAWLWRRRWFKKRGLAIAMIAWSVFYLAGALSQSSEYESRLTAIKEKASPSTYSATEKNDADQDTVSAEEAKANDEESNYTSNTSVPDNEPAATSSSSGNTSPAQPAADADIAIVNSSDEDTQMNAQDTAANSQGDDCTIKGNVNSKGEKIYHTPASRSYNRTEINTEEGDRWFCTEQEARDAGFRSSLD